jgi:hypothetical protein
MRCSYLISLTLLVFPRFSYTQHPQALEIDVQSFIEAHFDTQDADINYEDLYESLFSLYTNPLEINQSTNAELRALHILSEIQIKSLMDHLETKGSLLSLYELQTIPYFDQSTIDKLRPFIKIRNTQVIDNRSMWRRLITTDNNYLIVRYEQSLQTKKGFKSESTTTPARYSGDQGKYYLRFRTSHVNDFSIGFTLEKDAGEQFIWDKQYNRYGSDFHSFHIYVQQKAFIKNLVIGDYQLQIGQGLLSSAGFSVGKGAETINTVRKNHLGIRPYTSVIESGFYRGVASTLRLKTIDFTPFISHYARDAILRQDVITNEAFISALQASGFHRTESEINAKKTVEESVIGGNIAHLSKNKNLHMSATAIYTSYSIPTILTNRYYNQFDFNGNQNLIIGMAGSYQWRNINLFAEVGRSQSSGIGAVGGFLASLTPKLDLAVSMRHYSPDFHSLHGRAFGENTVNKNESGTYWGLKYKHNEKLILSAYYDTFRFPWLKSGVKSPSIGYEYLMRLEYKPSKTINLYAQYREESKAKSVDQAFNPLAIIRQGIKRNYLINSDYQATKTLTFKTRVQMSQYDLNQSITHGVALIQDAAFKFGKFTISSRYAIFQTDDYENRQYVYEKDVLYAFSIPAYDGLGSRNYLLIQFKLNRNWNFWARYAVTHYRDRKIIGSGLEEIDGNIKSALKLQLRIKL